VISPWATLEEAYLLAKLAKSVAPNSVLALGPVRVAGDDDHYPKDVHGNAINPPKFTIRAEKCPNRRGVEAVLKHFEGNVISFGDVLQRIDRGEVNAVYLLGGDPHGSITEADAAKLSSAKVLIVQDLLSSTLSDKAQYVLAGAAWAEKDGTFVNHKGLAQAIYRALRGPGESRPDGRILWDLSGRHGLFHAPTLRQEIANEIPELAGLKGDLGEEGVLLADAGKPELQPAT
jgi:NADH-quinone oxidoreductase subunit G